MFLAIRGLITEVFCVVNKLIQIVTRMILWPLPLPIQKAIPFPITENIVDTVCT
jgi:hypothetical protein